MIVLTLFIVELVGASPEPDPAKFSVFGETIVEVVRFIGESVECNFKVNLVTSGGVFVGTFTGVVEAFDGCTAGSDVLFVVLPLTSIGKT